MYTFRVPYALSDIVNVEVVFDLHLRNIIVLFSLLLYSYLLLGLEDLGGLLLLGQLFSDEFLLTVGFGLYGGLLGRLLLLGLFFVVVIAILSSCQPLDKVVEVYPHVFFSFAVVQAATLVKLGLFVVPLRVESLAE